MKNYRPAWDGVEVGAKIDELVITPDAKQIFMFSAVTWNRHAIHYDSRRAQSEGLPDVVVQRALIGNFLAHFLERGFGENADVCRLEWRVVHSAVPGDTLTCRGSVTDRYTEGDRKLVACEIEMINQHSDVIASGAATVAFAS